MNILSKTSSSLLRFKIHVTLFIFFLTLFGAYFLMTAQTAPAAPSSGCAITKIGNPSGAYPTMSPECQSSTEETSRADCTGNTGSTCAFEFMVGKLDKPVTYWPEGCCIFTGPYKFGKHEGVDLLTPYRREIKSLEDGILIHKGSGGTGGYSYTIRDKNGRYHLGLHMDHASTIPVGNHVTRGQLIGYVASTGSAGGSRDHLHYQISPPMSHYPQSGEWRDPQVVLSKWPNY